MHNSAKKQRFLQAFSNGATVSAASACAGVARRIVRQWELKDPEFGQAWRQARRQRVRDLAFDLVLDGDVPLIKALRDLEDQPWQDPGLEQAVGRIEIVDRPGWGGGGGGVGPEREEVYVLSALCFG